MRQFAKILAAGLVMAATSGAVSAKDLSLSYFMGPRHPMNKAVFQPFADKLKELSGGKLTVTQFPGGALNSVPPKQYSILLNGVADIAFHLPGYTAQLFPMTNVIATPGVCDSATSCTEALLRARPALEKEYNAKVLAIWANSPPILLTRDKPVTKLEDLKGLKLRVTSAANVPYIKALGASPVSQPVSVINQNLANGVIDGIIIGASGIGAFKLYEPAKYLTTWMPSSGSAFVLLMNKGVYNALSAAEKGWVDAAAGDWLSMGGGKAYDAASARGMGLAKKKGIKVHQLNAAEKDRFNKAIAGALADFHASKVAGGKTGADVVKMLKGM